MARLSLDRRRAGVRKVAEVGAAQPRRRAPRLLWLLPLAVALLIAAGALYEYAGPPAAANRVYIATQQLRLALPVAGATSTYDAYLARQSEDTAARALASGAPLQSPALDATIAARYATAYADLPQSAAHAGAPRRVTSAEVAAALTATHTGNRVTLTAHWQSPQGARALLTAAVTTLAEDGVAVPAAASGPASITVAVQVAGPASTATVDSTVAAAALHTLLVRLAFAVAAGAVTLLAIGWVMARRA